MYSNEYVKTSIPFFNKELTLKIWINQFLFVSLYYQIKSIMEKLKSIELVKNERLRQITEEGYSWEHDDQELPHTLSDAAIVYATPAMYRHEIMHKWPWDKKFYKPDTTGTYDGRIRELTKAGALICAEIDRLIRIKERVDYLAKHQNGKEREV